MAISTLWRIPVGTRATFSPVEQFCVCEVTSCEFIRLHHLPSVCVCLFHSGGLAERLNRLQCRQRSAISFWRHDAAAAGDPRHTNPVRSGHKPLSPLMLTPNFHVGGWGPRSLWLFGGATLRGFWLQFDHGASERELMM